MRKLLSIGALAAASLFMAMPPANAGVRFGVVIGAHHHHRYRYWHHGYYVHGRYYPGYWAYGYR